jgi:predicted metal-binding membrane protein
VTAVAGASPRPWRQYLPVLAVSVLAWASLWLMAVQHSTAAGGAGHVHAQTPALLLTWLMWCGMAVAMMLPTALPALATLEELNATARARGQPVGSPGWFALGFVLVWFVFGLLAALLQIALQHGMLLDSAGETTSRGLTAGLFMLAGAYQFTAMKHACLSRCRSPMTFFMQHWQDGNAGYGRMGMRMGIFCLGCCWAMMLLMFALGVMNLAWMGLLTIYMYAEKNWIRAPWVDKATGALFLAVGLGLLLAPVFNWN